MNFCLLLLSVLLFFILFFLTSHKGGFYTRIRLAFVLSLIANATVIYLYNEVFSFFDYLNATSAIIFWSAEVLALSGWLVYRISTGKITLPERSLLSEKIQLKGMSRSNKIILAGMLLVFVLPLLFLAVYAPPNNFDAHSYHLNRVLYWIINENLDHFPTEHIQQLYHNVFAEYLVLDGILLSGSDRFAGLIQFGSFIGSLAGISLLAKRLGMKADGQVLATVFLLTLPIGIFESTSVQVDYVACFFFISVIYFGFTLLQEQSFTILLPFLLALSLGGFTKYTVLIFALPFIVYFAVRILAQYGFVYSLKVFFLAVVLMALTFTPFFYRNYTLFGSVISPLEQSRFFSEKIPVDKHSFLFALSGIIKNSSLHMGLPYTGYNQFIYSKISAAHQWLGIDLDDPGLRLDTFSVRYSVHEDMVPNTLHFWLIVMSGILLFFHKGRRDIKWFATCMVLGFILFCTLLKFQLWSSRTHMPFFAMGSILVAYVYSEFLKLKPLYLILPLMLLSTVFVYGNPNKALIPLSYLTKKALGHIPVAFCETDSLKSALYEKDLSTFYDFPGKDNCHPLKQWPAYSQRLKIFNQLEKHGYYDDDKSSTVFTMDRTQSYFLSHLDNYYGFKPLLKYIKGDNENIGILFRKENGFYHYWSAVSTQLKNPGHMQYIRYLKEFAGLKNAHKNFYYDYILCDDPDLLKEFIAEKDIAEIHHTSLFYLVKLKNRSSRVLLF